MSDRKVPPVHIRTKDEVSDALAKDWLSLAPMGQRAAFAMRIGAKDYKTVSKAISGEHMPEAHTMLNSLVVDPVALFNVFRLFGGVFVPINGAPVDDMETISGMLRAATEYVERVKDGKRCHVDTAALAALFRPLVPALLAIIDEANRSDVPAIRSAA